MLSVRHSTLWNEFPSEMLFWLQNQGQRNSPKSKDIVGRVKLYLEGLELRNGREIIWDKRHTGHLKNLLTTCSRKKDAEMKIVTRSIKSLDELVDGFEVVGLLQSGSFGEVFRLRSGDVLKLIPFDFENWEGTDTTWAGLRHEINVNNFIRAKNMPELVTLKEYHFACGSYAKSLKQLWLQKATPAQKKKDWRPWHDHQEVQNYAVFIIKDAGKTIHSIKPALSDSELVQVVFETSRILDKAYSKLEFEHRDCHSGNVLISREDNKLVVRLIDFGLSKVKDLSVVPPFLGDHLRTLLDSQPAKFHYLQSLRLKGDFTKSDSSTSILWLVFFGRQCARRIKCPKLQGDLQHFLLFQKRMTFQLKEFVCKFEKEFC